MWAALLEKSMGFRVITPNIFQLVRKLAPFPFYTTAAPGLGKQGHIHTQTYTHVHAYTHIEGDNKVTEEHLLGPHFQVILE